jgi:VanZ family protein
VQKWRVFLWYWLPVILWMALIFTGSADTSSFQHSSRIIGPILHWLFPNMAPDTVNELVFIARKGAHLTEYAILGLLFWRALRRPNRDVSRPWDWPLAGRALLLTALYAASDEFHQYFVPSRQSSVIDVLIDSSGAAAGLVLLWLFGRWRKWW